MNSLPQEILAKFKTFFGQNKSFIALHEPSFRGNEWKYVKDCLDTGWVSSVGKYVDQFENNLAAFTGAKRAIACVNGTSALSVCLKLAGVQNHDEVLVPTLTFIATANAICYNNAIPHFVDSDETHLGICTLKLADYLANTVIMKNGFAHNRVSGRRIAALIAVHIFGHPVDLDPLVEICNRYNITLIEDAAEALGSSYKNKHVGNFGKVSALSFNGNKIITTGGGGAILTNDEKLGALAKHMTTTAKLPHPWEFRHDLVGYNYRMPNINAALGVAQLEILPQFLEKKKKLAAAYSELFKTEKAFKFLTAPQYAHSNYWLNAIILDPSHEDQRDNILKICNDNQIMLRPLWSLIHTLEPYQDCPRMGLDVAESLFKRTINIPSSSCLGDEL